MNLSLGKHGSLFLTVAIGFALTVTSVGKAAQTRVASYSEEEQAELISDRGYSENDSETENGRTVVTALIGGNNSSFMLNQLWTSIANKVVFLLAKRKVVNTVNTDSSFNSYANGVSNNTTGVTVGSCGYNINGTACSSSGSLVYNNEQFKQVKAVSMDHTRTGDPAQIVNNYLIQGSFAHKATHVFKNLSLQGQTCNQGITLANSLPCTIKIGLSPFYYFAYSMTVSHSG